MNYRFLEEILLLAEQLTRSSKKTVLTRARREYVIAKTLVEQGKRLEAVKHAVTAYDTLYF